MSSLLRRRGVAAAHVTDARRRAKDGSLENFALGDVSSTLTRSFKKQAIRRR